MCFFNVETSVDGLTMSDFGVLIVGVLNGAVHVCCALAL